MILYTSWHTLFRQCFTTIFQLQFFLTGTKLLSACHIHSPVHCLESPGQRFVVGPHFTPSLRLYSSVHCLCTLSPESWLWLCTVHTADYTAASFHFPKPRDQPVPLRRDDITWPQVSSQLHKHYVLLYSGICTRSKNYILTYSTHLSSSYISGTNSHKCAINQFDKKLFLLW